MDTSYSLAIIKLYKYKQNVHLREEKDYYHLKHKINYYRIINRIRKKNIFEDINYFSKFMKQEITNTKNRLIN